MNSLRQVAAALAMIMAAFSALAADAQGGAIRLEISVLPGIESHAALLAEPGYLAIALENNGIVLSFSSRPKVGDGGRSVEVRGVMLKYVGRTDSVFRYEAGIGLGVGGTQLKFPVTVDLAAAKSGKVVVTLSPALGGLVPDEIVNHIRLKVQAIANPDVQRGMVDYLGRMAAQERATAAQGGLGEVILLDAYRKGGGAAPPSGRDAGDAVPLSEQWMLIITLLVWGVMLPGVYFYRRRRSQS